MSMPKSALVRLVKASVLVTTLAKPTIAPTVAMGAMDWAAPAFRTLRMPTGLRNFQLSARVSSAPRPREMLMLTLNTL